MKHSCPVFSIIASNQIGYTSISESLLMPFRLSVNNLLLTIVTAPPPPPALCPYSLHNKPFRLTFWTIEHSYSVFSIITSNQTGYISIAERKSTPFWLWANNQLLTISTIPPPPPPPSSPPSPPSLSPPPSIYHSPPPPSLFPSPLLLPWSTPLSLPHPLPLLPPPSPPSLSLPILF